MTSDFEVLKLGIELGLGDLFNDNREAMNKWLNKPRPDFDGKSALEHMADGKKTSASDVVRILDRARGLE